MLGTVTNTLNIDPSLRVRMPHKPREKFKTEHNVFDKFTNRILFKLISEGHFSGLESAIALGKEANVFSAKRKGEGRVIVKIYRLEASDFHGMYNVLKTDPRYVGLKGKRRKIIFQWVQREYRNLLKAREAGVSAPTPITFKDNVLVMEYFGTSEEVAPRLVSHAPKNKAKFFDMVVEDIKKLYRFGMVHGDLSGFNILNFRERPMSIDFSQAITRQHPDFDALLKRDVKNVCGCFAKFKFKRDPDKVLSYILKDS